MQYICLQISWPHLNKKKIAIPLSALFLLALMLMSSTGRLFHVLTSHHHAHELKVCAVDDTRDEHNVHLHGPEFALEDCRICHFLVQSPFLPLFSGIVLPELVHIPSAKQLAPEMPFIAAVQEGTFLRGPPQHWVTIPHFFSFRRPWVFIPGKCIICAVHQYFARTLKPRVSG